MSRGQQQAGTIASDFDPRNNSLNFFRLLLALSVIVVHSARLGGFESPWIDRLHLGDIGVDFFFVISGYLITRSWVHRPRVGRYAWHRFLRIMPGYWGCIAVTVFIAAPIAWLHAGDSLGDYFSQSSPWAYLLQHLPLTVSGDTAIAGTPTGIPRTGNWNASIWTLPWEALCYVGVAVLGVLGVLRGRRWLVPALFAGFWLLNAVREFTGVGHELLTSQYVASTIRFGLLFTAGMVLYLFGDRVPMRDWLAAVALVLLLVSFTLHTYVMIAALPIGYLALWFAIRVPMRLGNRHDLSYGVYIYGYIVGQILAVFGLYRFGYLPYVAMSVAGALAVACVSWFVIERRALRWKNWSPSRRQAAPDLSMPPAAQGDLV